MWIYLSVHIWACDAPKRKHWKASRSTLAGGALQANMKTFWSRVTFADCCQHLFPSLFSSQTIPDVVSQPVGGQCEQEIGEKGSFFSKEFVRGWGKSRRGRSRWGKDWGGKAATPMFQRDPLQTLPAAAWLFPCHKKEGWIERCTCLFWHLTSQQTRCWRKKETGCTENYIAGQWLSMDTTSRWTLVQVFSAFVQATSSYKWAKHSRIQKLDPCHVSYPPRPGQSAMILPPHTPRFKIIISPLVFQCKIWFSTCIPM